MDSPEKIEKWDDLNLKLDLLRGIYSYGFEYPSSIQRKTILPIITKNDLIAQAQSGSGKTGAFTIGSLQNLDINEKKTQILVIAPTHELVKQISAVFQSIGSFYENLTVKTLIGGNSVSDDIAELKNNVPHIIVGCTGRIYDMIQRRQIDTANIRTLIIDEADEMLSFGFKENIYNIFQFLNENIQVCLFSATMPEEVLELTKKFMRNPVKIIMKTKELTVESIQQFFIALENDNQKYETIKNLFSNLIVSQSIIYVNSVGRVINLHDAMLNDGYSVCCIHSNMTKTERECAFAEFRKGSSRVLISSNITARGIDIQQVSTVINFDIPKDVNTYLHRIGRGGRYGRKGLAINFVTRYDVQLMKNIEKHFNINIKEFPSNFVFF
jgi:translation initiation factor 4A